jgi:hypothetical protein
MVIANGEIVQNRVLGIPSTLVWKCVIYDTVYTVEYTFRACLTYSFGADGSRFIVVEPRRRRWSYFANGL